MARQRDRAPSRKPRDLVWDVSGHAPELRSLMAPDAKLPPIRTVLMLASGYPPDGQFILRTAKFAEYLPEFGWRPLILTPINRSGSRPGLKVPARVRRYRVPGFPSPSRMARGVHLAFTHATRQRTTGAAPGSLAFPSPPARLLRQALLWFETPDALNGWIPFSVLSGWLLSRRFSANVVHASGPPFSVVVAGVLLSRIIRRPLIADFRDAWTLDQRDPFGTLGGSFQTDVPPARTRLLRSLERWAVRQSGVVVFTSRSTLGLHAHQYPELAHRFHLIFNGADEADFSEPCEPFEKPTLTHVGTLHDYQWEHMRDLLGVLTRLRSDGSIPQAARLALVGPVGTSLRARIQAETRALGIEEVVVLTGPVPHSEAVTWMCRSWLQLLFVGDNPVIRLSKLSECVAARRPMLAFGDPDGETGREVKEHGGIVAHDPGTELALRAITRFLRGKPAAQLACRIRHPHPLSRRTEAAELAALLNELSDKRDLES